MAINGVHYALALAPSLARARRRSRIALLIAALCTFGCNAFDGELVPPGFDGGPGSDGGLDGAVSGSGGSSGSGGQGGAGAAGQAGSPIPGDAGQDDCRPAPPDADASCIQICRERCNDEDDDCDGKVDEGTAAALCELDHAIEVCVAGDCLVSDCEPGYRDCDNEPDNGCEAPDDDVRNCGECNRVCAFAGAIAACIDEECEAVGCAEGRGDCEDKSADCETSLSTADNCGACGQPCDGLPNATAQSCATGECTATTCALGYGDCNDRRSDGCETAVNSVEHCTECGKECDLTGSSGDDCDNYVCRAGPCDDGYGECDGVRENGCEPLTTINNCGRCNQACGGEDLENIAGASCESGRCVPECLEGFGDCDNQPFTGCETSIRTNDDCGACDEPCVLPNAVPTCEGGTCEIARCNPGWLDCNDDPDDGCEKSSNDDDTCGDCDTACEPPDPVCSGGTCGDVTCPAGLADCAQDGLPCENTLATDEDHCGACNQPCRFNAGITSHSAPLQCLAGVCEVTCEPGWDDCNNDYRDGCETPLNTLTNCGSCGMACAIPNAGESCSTGECLITTCAPDFRDCDGDMRSCERAVNTTSDCGACNAACTLANATPACVGSPGARSCAIGTCVQFFDDCDGNPGNGCEVNLQTDTDDCGRCDYDCRAEEHVASATCSGGSCNFTCDTGFRDCNGMDGDGCETPITTATNCGACGVSCSRQNGMSSCASGRCELTGCNGGFDECDGDEDNGCESLSTVTNCGACGDACLPPNATGTCSTGSCQIASCASGWSNCDGDPTNGCERNTAMLGPCLPDSGCVRSTFGGGEYYYCPTARSWAAARDRCRMQLYGDLVRIDSAAENAHVYAQVTAPATDVPVWIGGTDADPIASEGQWRWSNDTTLFWTGVANGMAPSGVYTNWSANEPNQYMGAEEDCAEMAVASGAWNDHVCSNTRAFVCEVAGDLCPTSDKTAPGQCGCATPDVDTDGDRTMDCIDACPNDANKIAAGVCGCGVADTDGDGDGTPNCNDQCPANPMKVTPGMCGCDTADVDSDNDGTANCNDRCPSDPTRTELPCAFPFSPTHYSATGIDYVNAPSSTLDCSSPRTVTIDTSGSVTITNWCGTAPAPVIRAQTGGPELAIVPLRGLTIPSSTTLRVIGSRPLVLSVNGDASIQGVINARGLGTTPGAGGNVSCSAGAIGDNGAHDSAGDDGSAGGAGGAFVTTGGAGGNGRGGPNGAPASTAEANGNNTTPLRGGCQGGNGGGSGGGRQGGAGGGAIAISVSGTLNISGNSARVSASGGGGRRGDQEEDGGGGGGSGGAVLIEAGVLNITGGWVTANGGGGASGNHTSSVNGAHGSDGLDNGSGTTPGGAGVSDGGGGGGVGAGASAGAGSGGHGNPTYVFFFIEVGGAGGGGGGGGRGRVHYRGVTSCNLGGSSSPSATRSGACQ